MNFHDSPLQKCYTIPPEMPFLPALSRWVLKNHAPTPESLVNTLILLPNRRSCRAMREAFLAETQGKALLLPRIQPLGDMEEDALLPLAQELGALIPPIPPLKRHLLLTQLVHGFQKRYNLLQAAELARQLANLIDEAQREQLSFDRLATLVPAELAGHWQETLSFLTIISKHWPAILENEGMSDPVTYRDQTLLALAAHWQRLPPDYPVIAAGTVGMQPAIAKLLATIASLPQGAIVLPGVDTAMPEREWEMVSETHPQYGTKQLLAQMECSRSIIKVLPGVEQVEPAPRTQCLNAILQPPEVTSHWQGTILPLKEGLQNVRILTAETQLDEARMIGVVLREALETPGKTAALITPDRTLAKMVIAQMQRYGIAIDDSAGMSLIDTPPGCLLRLTADMVASRAAPAPLLALLRHPLAAAGVAPSECRRLSRIIELYSLRGIRMTAGMEALLDTPDLPEPARQFLARMAAAMEPFSVLFSGREVPLKRMLEAHLAFAQWMAHTPDESGGENLWKGAAGNQLAGVLAELMNHADMLPEIDPVIYPRLLEVLLGSHVFRPHFGLHPRLHILGPIEARLQYFDRAIIGGLNEGTWPTDTPADPWMSRPMRGAFGLPARERDIGQSANDVYLLCAAPEVFLTRASKVEGAPTVPSRWLARLATLVGGQDSALYQSLHWSHHYESAIRGLDAPLDITPCVRPMPCPPVSARPRQLRVTAIDQWLRDPYMVYAAYILKLRNLKPLDKEPDASDFGTLIHQSMEHFTKDFPSVLPDKPLETLRQYGREAFAAMLSRPSVACLWWPRFEGMAQWLIEREQERRGHIIQLYSELQGQWECRVGDAIFTLTTRIDRLEIHRDGSMTLVDYKTGTLPTNTEIEEGLANQLLLEALIAREGTLTVPIPKATPIESMEYWKLSGRVDHCEIKYVEPGLIEEARVRLVQLVEAFDHPDMPYAAQNNPAKLTRFNDYAHLTRREEWEAV